MADPLPRFACVDPDSPAAFAICDRCGQLYNLRDLAWQMEWNAQRLFQTGAFVCRRVCLDVPNETLRVPLLPPDPPPVLNARVPNYAYEEQTTRILEYNAPDNPSWGAGPQILRALQGGEVARLLEYTSEANIGRITDQTLLSSISGLTGAEIMEIALATGAQFSVTDGRLTSLPAFPLLPTGVEIMELIATGRGNSAGTTENATFVPIDGELTSLQLFAIALAGTEVMELVMPNNAQTGQNYQITTALLAAFFSTYPFLNTARVPQGSTYNLKTSDTRVLIVAGSAAPTTIIAPLAASMLVPFPVLVKDGVGNANAHAVTISFTSGELCDGMADVVINNDYGWVTLNPTPGGGGWYLS